MKRVFPLILLCCICLLFAACTENETSVLGTPPAAGQISDTATETQTVSPQNIPVTDTDTDHPSVSPRQIPPPCDHAYGPWKTAIPAEEETEGLERRVCTLCEEEETRALSALPLHLHNYTETVYLPTCLEEGYTLKTCRCGDSAKTDSTPASGHVFGTWILKKPPTIEEEGLQNRSCDTCGATETERLEKLPAPKEIHEHIYTETVLPPTCLTDGSIHRACPCGEDQQLPGDPAHGHDYMSWHTSLLPGEYAGLSRRDCLICGEVELKTIPAHPSEASPTKEDHKETGTVTYYNQRNERWGEMQIGCGDMKNNGCGPSSIAMVLSYFGTQVTPPEVAHWLYKYTIEFNHAFHGISATGIRLALEHWNRKVVPLRSYEEMIAHLKNGAVIIGAQGEGSFVSHPESSHCIVIFDLTSSGKLTCYDSYTERLCGTYSAKRIWSERSTLPVDLRNEGVTHFAVY